MDQNSNQGNNNFIVLTDFLKNTEHHCQERKSYKFSGKVIEMKNVLEIEYSWNSDSNMQFISNSEE